MARGDPNTVAGLARRGCVELEPFQRRIARAAAGDERELAVLLTYRILGATCGGEDLFATFWRRAAPALRREVLTHAGWSLEKTSKLEPAVRDRLIATWEWTLEAASNGGTAPLAGLGAWLGTAALDGGCLLGQARAVSSKRPSRAGLCCLPLSSTRRFRGSQHPREAVEVVRRMVLTDAEGWSLHGSTDEVS